MYCEVFSTTIVGVSARIVSVETDVGRGLPVFDMGGYLAAEVKEAKERVRVALRNSGYEIKPQRITVNISPADIRKEGTGFDLPIALGILGANEEIDMEMLKSTIVIGELSLDGSVNSVKGILASVCEAFCQGFKRCIVPWEDYREGAVIEGIEVLPVKNLRQLAAFLNGKEALCQEEALQKEYRQVKAIDFADVQGQETAKRATMIAAAGMHNIMYIGAPGCGKTMLAKRIPDILPDMTFKESLELTQIYSIAGLIDKNEPLMKKRPFRSPHHSVTQTALLGGGLYPKPGEVTLAGKGVLFLDELTEYKPSLLESLRQPLEEKKITINRMGSSCDYPADFMLAAAMNPCKCGYYPDRNRCCCTEAEVKRFLGKISRPMWDRFDVCVQVQDVTIDNIKHKSSADASHEGSSAYMKEKVETARKWQQERFKDTEIHFNSQMNVSHIEKYCVLDEEEKELLLRVYETFHLTMRGYHKILKVARTIADIDESEKICVQHLSEALSYRSYN